MASITRPRPPTLSPPVSRPLAPHPGLEIELAPLPPIRVLPRVQARVQGRWLGYEQWAIWRIAFIGLCGLALACTAALYGLSLTNYLSTEGDNAIYVILAKAMATGHGYTNIQSPVPRIEAQFPPLFPLLLLPVVRVWGSDAVAQMQALVTVFALGSFVLCFFLFRRWLGSAILALSIAAATAATDLIWSFSHKVLTEIPYLFFTLLACWWATRYAQEPKWRSLNGALAALAAVAAFYTRTIGLGLLVALPLYLLLAPPLHWRGGDWPLRLRKVGLVSSVLVVFAGGWILRNRIVYSGSGHTYTGQFWLKQTYVPDAGSAGLRDLLDRVGTNVDYYGQVYQRMLGGHIWDHIPASGDLSQGLLAISLLGFLYALIRRRTLAEFYIVGYVGIVLLWPWYDLRFAVPVLPFLIYYLANALLPPMILLARFRPIDPRVAAAMVLLPLAGPTAVHTLHTAMLDRQAGYHYEVERLGEWPAYPDWQDFHAAAEWLRTYGVPGSTVINRSPNLLYLWTGLASRNYPYSFSQKAVLEDITKEHNDYIIDDRFSWTFTTSIYLDPVLRANPDAFVPVFTSHGTTVYQAVGQ